MPSGKVGHVLAEQAFGQLVGRGDDPLAGGYDHGVTAAIDHGAYQRIVAASRPANGATKR